MMKSVLKSAPLTKATIYTTTQGAEALCPILERAGIVGYSVEDPADVRTIMENKEKLAWDYLDEAVLEDPDAETRVSFYAEEGAGNAALLCEVRTALLRLKADEQYGYYGADAAFGRLWMETETVGDEWKTAHIEHFHTFEPCAGIVIRPPWEAYTARAGEIVVRIDPGMAFGTGTHETTSLCLGLLRKTVRPGDQVLDVGTGSGILAIAAAKLGAGHVTAVELDEDAAASALGNIRANDAMDRIDLIHGDILDAGLIRTKAAYRIITANLTSGILKLLLPRFAELLAADGVLILSGILDAQEDGLRESLENTGYHASYIGRKGEWIAIEAARGFCFCIG